MGTSFIFACQSNETVYLRQHSNFSQLLYAAIFLWNNVIGAMLIAWMGLLRDNWHITYHQQSNKCKKHFRAQVKSMYVVALKQKLLLLSSNLHLSFLSLWQPVTLLQLRIERLTYCNFLHPERKCRKWCSVGLSCSFPRDCLM